MAFVQVLELRAGPLLKVVQNEALIWNQNLQREFVYPFMM